MPITFSKRLESTLHDIMGGYLTARQGEVCLDKLFLAVLDDRESHGSLIVSALLRDWELDRVRSRVENALSCGDGMYYCADARALKDYIVSKLAIIYGDDIPRVINTGHLMFALTGDRRLHSSRIVEKYAVTPLMIFRHLIMLPRTENYLRRMSRIS